MKKIVSIIIIIICIITGFILLCLSINNVTNYFKYDNYGYEIANRKIYKINLAIEENNIKGVKKLIKHTDLNKRPLKTLTEEEREDIIDQKKLNEDTIYPDEDIDYYNLPPLSNACKNKNIPIIKLLIENGADVNYLSNGDYESSPLYATLYAYVKESQKGDDELDKYMSILELLIKNNLQIEMKQKNNKENPLSFLARNQISNKTTDDNIELFKILIKNSKEEMPTEIKGDILSDLVWSNNLELIDYLIDNENYDINTRDSYNKNALFSAVAKNDEKIVKYLINKGIDTKAKDSSNMTAYDWAIYLGGTKKEVIDLLK